MLMSVSLLMVIWPGRIHHWLADTCLCSCTLNLCHAVHQLAATVFLVSYGCDSRVVELTGDICPLLCCRQPYQHIWVKRGGRLVVLKELSRMLPPLDTEDLQ